jgi:hypothetical protein
MFSDESSFRICQLHKCYCEEAKTMNRYKSKFTIPTGVQHAAGVMVWGCVRGNSWQGKNVLSAQDQQVQDGHGGAPDPLHELSQSEDLHAGRRPLPQEQEGNRGTEEGKVFNPGLTWELSRLELLRKF